MPVIQSCVADVSSQRDRPQYMGRIMATFGAGFVIGPAISALMSSSSMMLSTRDKIQLSALLPLTGFIVSSMFFKETKNSKDLTRSSSRSNDKANTAVSVTTTLPINKEVLFLILNGFMIMYAFGTETIYAMFIKDSFGYGERTLRY